MDLESSTYVGPWDRVARDAWGVVSSTGAQDAPPVAPPPARSDVAPVEEWPPTVARGRGRALLFLGVTLVVGVLLAQLPVGSLILYARLSGRGMGWIDAHVLDADAMPPLTLLVVNLTLGCCGPAALLAARVVYRLRPGQLLSRTGRWRWSLVGRTALCVVPLWLGYLAITTSVEGPSLEGRPPQVAALLLVAVATTPLQVFGEEVLFRLVPLAVLGGLAGPRRLAWARGLATVVATAGFVLAHGSSDPAVDASLAAFALVAMYLTVVSGGLEQAWTVHLTNNLCTQVSAILLGGWGSSFIGQSDASSGPTAWSTLAAIPTLLLVTVLVRRFGTGGRGRRGRTIRPGGLGRVSPFRRVQA